MTENTATPGDGYALLGERDPRPVIALPRTGLSGVAIAGAATLLATMLFVALDARRPRARSETMVSGQANAFPAPPALVIPPAPAPPQVIESSAVNPEPPPSAQRPPAPDAPPAPPPANVVMTVPQPPPPLPNGSEMERSGAPVRQSGSPALVIDEGIGGGEAGQGSAAAAQQQGSAGSGIAIDDVPARATAIRNRTTVMPMGTLIAAVLETPIDTARPGLVRAVVSQDARGFDGQRVLVPKGSRLIGDYQSDIRSGQNRVLVSWARLIRPDGVAIRLGSPAADRLGGAGMAGRVNSFFFQRFAGAVLQSALSVGINLASRPGDGSVIVGLPAGQINNAIGQGLLPNDLRPKITVKQGAALNVFVARDLDFSGTPLVR